MRDKNKERLAERKRWAREMAMAAETSAGTEIPNDLLQSVENYQKKYGRFFDTVLFCRVSGRAQYRNGGLRRQIAGSKKQLKLFGVTVVAAIGEKGPGWTMDRNERRILIKAFRTAGRLQVPLTTPCPTRLACSPDYNTQFDPDAAATTVQWEWIESLKEKFNVPAILRLRHTFALESPCQRNRKDGTEEEQKTVLQKTT